VHTELSEGRWAVVYDAVNEGAHSLMHLPLVPGVEAGVAFLDGEGLQPRAQWEDDLCYLYKVSGRYLE
jgi:hypothetical protein